MIPVTTATAAMPVIPVTMATPATLVWLITMPTASSLFLSTRKHMQAADNAVVEGT